MVAYIFGMFLPVIFIQAFCLVLSQQFLVPLFAFWVHNEGYQPAADTVFPGKLALADSFCHVTVENFSLLKRSELLPAVILCPADDYSRAFVWHSEVCFSFVVHEW